MSFDIETTQINNEDFHHAYMYIWQFAVDEIAIYGRTWRAFNDFYNTLVRVFKLGQEIPSKAKQKGITRQFALCIISPLKCLL
jgi:hypothetical protein